MNRSRFAAIIMIGLSCTLTGCANDPLTEQYREGSSKGYIAGDGTVTQIPETTRGTPVSFEGTSETGKPISSNDYTNTVLVVNFWYASCAPCRAEAPDLQTLNQQFSEQGANFLGINVRDQAPTAIAFNNTYGITYPSIIDVNTGSVKLAFSGDVPPNAVPTTLVLDRAGRVAARILGAIDVSILRTLITDSLT
jgi:thiol-disulfide isomerase/thioredoxin